eukprot:423265_1
MNRVHKFVYKAENWPKRTITRIGPCLSLRFSARQFTIGYYSAKKHGHRFPPRGILLEDIKKNLNQVQIDHLIDSYDQSIDINFVKRTFVKWNDIQNDKIFIKD